MQITEQEIEQIAKKAGEAAVQDLLTKLGIDISDVHETQKDFAYLRGQRQTSDQVGVWTRRIMLGFVLTSAGTLLVTGIKTAFVGLLQQP
ncbi:hypothetical protein [uncultured Microbulbifer sp.]|uniref:hypothetical protein n=1 Tax=uncultured Microbulbifer sp. TaxID=348147 RepID=UPI002635FE92|nr:hypothetical protein [uncultured Microbulbifer sp.]